ncbi:MAG: cytochrome c biogenesis protein CcsA [Polyangiaceae bacterium]|jgi:heme exporter protein C
MALSLPPLPYDKKAVAPQLGADRRRLGRTRRRALDMAFYSLVTLTAVTFVGEIFFIFLKAPVEARMGIVQKIFYFHVPSAYAMYIGAAACFSGSIAYLVRPTRAADAFARAGAEAAVVFGSIVLTTGPLWGAKAWGALWTWDPRLTTELLGVLIYVAYLVLRSFAGDGDGERRFSAALGILGAANLPIIHFSVQKWGGQHPTVITGSGGGLQHPDMKTGLALGFFAFTLLAALLLWARTRIEIANSRLRQAEEDAVDLGLDTRTEG